MPQPAMLVLLHCNDSSSSMIVRKKKYDMQCKVNRHNHKFKSTQTIVKLSQATTRTIRHRSDPRPVHVEFAVDKVAL
jgi:hypothetical protein